MRREARTGAACAAARVLASSGTGSSAGSPSSASPSSPSSWCSTCSAASSLGPVFNFLGFDLGRPASSPRSGCRSSPWWSAASPASASPPRPAAISCRASASAGCRRRWGPRMDRLADVITGCFLLGVAYYGFKFVEFELRGRPARAGARLGGLAVPARHPARASCRRPAATSSTRSGPRCVPDCRSSRNDRRPDSRRWSRFCCSCASRCW